MTADRDFSRHPTGSPMLSKDEAPWIAYEMRRGLRTAPTQQYRVR